VWKSVTDLVPIVATEYYNQAGDMVYQETPTGLGKIVMRRATKAQALDEPVGEAPEILVSTFIKPSRDINNSMKSNRAKLRLVAKDGELPAIPSAGAQRVELAEDGKSALLVIDITDNLPASAAEVSSDEFTKPSAMVDFDDALVKKISEAAKDKPGTMEKADALRKVTHDRISRKGMATAFAAASETARTRTGDCSEHCVLLCALLRAQGIPARVAMGLVYVD
jgi:transglutaminase-like putative cysteine protease